MYKPNLCCDYNLAKVKFPCIVLPKIDGVRSLHLGERLTGRSLKQHENRHTTNFFTHELFRGFDGEMAAAWERDPDLCRITTSAMSTIAGQPFILWWLFDYVTAETIDLGYQARYEALCERLVQLADVAGLPQAYGHLRTVPISWAHNADELLAIDEQHLDLGYEGSIGRDPNGKYKQGRSTAREGGYWRIKRFLEFDARVDSFEEGVTNTNAAQVNELGRQFRSSHQDGMVRSGMIGALNCTALEEVKDGARVVIEKGQQVKVGPGTMPHDMRVKLFQNPNMILGGTIKVKFFPKGIKDKPRFPTFNGFRSLADKV